MKRLLLALFLAVSILASQQSVQAQVAPAITWQKTIGGNAEDALRILEKTADGGYIMGGYSNSGISGDKSQASKGLMDYWIIKVNASGNKIWDKTYGGNGEDVLESLQQTADGGYILGGQSESGISGDKTQANKGLFDYWIIKLDANGNKIWDKTIGGSNRDIFRSVIQTSDGGYLVGGYSFSGISGDKSQANRGMWDIWILKLDANGNKTWDKTIGGTETDDISILQQTPDGGYIMGGYSQSGIGYEKSEPDKGNGYNDYWLLKLNSSGNKIWDKTLGGDSQDVLYGLQQTSDGGFILAGSSYSGISGDKTQANFGIGINYDYWVVKVDATGNKTWDRSFGSNDYDFLWSVQQTTDGGYILGGYSPSGIGGSKSQASRGSNDFWVIKLDASGIKIWDKTIGGSGSDDVRSIKQTTDGGYIIGGSSHSGISGDKTQANMGAYDFWLVKLDPPCAPLTANLSGTCGTSGTDVNVNVAGNQVAVTGSNSWTLTYTVNGVTQTATGTSNTFSLATNAAVGTVYNLISIASGTCNNNLTETLTVQALPAAPAVTPGNSCGSGTVTLSASGAPAGGNYIWYNDPSMGTVLQNSTSNTFTTPSLSTNTTYYVAVTNNIGCESPRTPVTATITNLNVTPGSAQTICASASPVQLTGYSPAGGTWSGPGVSATGLFSPTNSLVGNQTLTYTVTQNGCTVSAGQIITVTATPVVSAGINDTVCANAAPYQLTGNSPAGGTWSGSGVNATGTFTPTAALAGPQNVTYSFTQNGCTVTATKQVVIPTPLLQPVITLFSPDTLIASTMGSSYEWKRNNTVIPGSKQKLKATVSGTYSVQVKDAKNCASPFSADFVYTVSGMKDDLQNGLKLYPNPTDGLLTLELQTARAFAVTVFNALGQQVLQKTVAGTDEKVQLDLSHVARGIYLVQVKTDTQIVVKKVVVK